MNGKVAPPAASAIIMSEIFIIIRRKYPLILSPSQKEFKSRFLRSQIILNLIKFIKKLLTFISPNKFSIKVLVMCLCVATGTTNSLHNHQYA